MAQNTRRRYAHTVMFALAYGAIVGAVLFARPLGMSATTELMATVQHLPAPR